MPNEFKMDCKGMAVTLEVHDAVNDAVMGGKLLGYDAIGNACITRDKNVHGKPHYTIYTGEDKTVRYFLLINGTGYLKAHEECKLDEKGAPIDPSDCSDKTAVEYETSSQKMKNILKAISRAEPQANKTPKGKRK